MTPGRLHFDATGKLQGAASITHNAPFPCVNGSFGSGAMLGVLMHTMVGQLQPGTVAVFNRPGFDASAHFGISQAGEIWQFGPIGKGWIAWHAMAANDAYYGIEHADAGNPANPLTEAQIIASAQVVEALSAFAGFPLAITDVPGGKGYGTHVMGGAAYGGHTCPGPGPRAGQRSVIIELAKVIRAATPPAPPPAPEGEPDMILVQVDRVAKPAGTLPPGTDWPGVFLMDSAGLHHVTSGADVKAYQDAGVRGPVTITYPEYLARAAAPLAKAAAAHRAGTPPAT